MPTTQDERLLKITTPLGPDFLLMKGMRCTEGISQLFRIELELLHEEEAEGYKSETVDPKSVVGHPMSIKVTQRDDAERYFHGICTELTRVGRKDPKFSQFQAVIVPAVWTLTQKSQSRIFQQINVPDILRKVFDGYEFNISLNGKYEQRNYCVQYRETDWDFASRLMEEEGIFYYFEHNEDNHRLVIADDPQMHKPCPAKSHLPFSLKRQEKKEEWMGSIHTWRIFDRLRTGKVELRDYNFQLPTQRLEAVHESILEIGNNKSLEYYDYPGEYAKRFDGIDKGGGDQANELQKIFSDRERTAKIRQQEFEVPYKNFYAHSDSCAPSSGYKFTLTEHPDAENNSDYVITSVVHEAVQSPSYRSGEDVQYPYSVNFVCIPRTVPFRPPRVTPKPIVYGSQTADVVGPSGEEIFTDKYGRVKVQFHWDRDGNMDSDSSCWVRVAQSWAGNKWGTMFIPRIGMEVVVDFLEGDPDQPIIVGCVYNPQRMPPYVLPDEKTKSTIKSNSSKGGGGFNEFRFEDGKGKEQIFIHAEKNQDIHVKNDCMESIDNDRHLTVGKNQNEKVKADKSLEVVGDHKEKIGGSMSLKVGMDIQTKADMKFAVDAGTEIHLKSGTTLTIETGTSLTLKVGGNFININPAGIFIKGAMVMLNSGGAAGSGSGSNPETPTEPKAAETGEAGQKLETKGPPPPPDRKTWKAGAGGASGSSGQSAEAASEGGSGPEPPALAIQLTTAAEDGSPFVMNI